MLDALAGALKGFGEGGFLEKSGHEASGVEARAFINFLLDLAERLRGFSESL